MRDLSPKLANPYPDLMPLLRFLREEMEGHDDQAPPATDAELDAYSDRLMEATERFNAAMEVMPHGPKALLMNLRQAAQEIGRETDEERSAERERALMRRLGLTG